MLSGSGGTVRSCPSRSSPPSPSTAASRRSSDSLETDDWVQLVAPEGATIAFQQALDHQPPQWPSADHPQQLHLDFDVPDLDAGEAAVLAIGARKADVQPGTSFRVFLDPAGHPFCLCQD
jgi:hypothetical protein